MLPLGGYGTDYAHLHYRAANGRKMMSLDACLDHHFGGQEAVVLPGDPADGLIFEGEHLQPGHRVRLEDFTNHGFNGVLAHCTFQGRRGTPIPLNRLAALPTGRAQVRALAQLVEPYNRAIPQGRPVIDIRILTREGPHVAITCGVNAKDRIVWAGYAHIEPVPGEASATAKVEFARALAARYLRDTPIPLDYTLPFRQAALEQARAAIPSTDELHARAATLNAAQGRALIAVASGDIAVTHDARIDNPPVHQHIRLASPTYRILHSNGFVEPGDQRLRTGRAIRLTPAGEQVHAHLLAHPPGPPLARSAVSRSTAITMPDHAPHEPEQPRSHLDDATSSTPRKR